MSLIKSTPELFSRLWLHISPRRRLQFFWLLSLMVLASLAEIISIGALLPFLAALSEPKIITENRLVQPLIHLLGISSPAQVLLMLSMLFGAAIILAAIMRLTLLWVSTRLSFAAGADLSNSIYRRTLYQPYTVHIARNSSEVISGITTKADSVIYGAIVPILTLLSSTVMIVFILITLFYVDPFIAMTSFIGFGLIYFLVVRIARKRLLSNSQKIARESTGVIKSLQEGLGGIRDVLIDSSQEVYCQTYLNADRPLRRAQGSNLFIAQSPRYGVEALGMLLMVGLAYVLALRSSGITGVIEILGVLALGAQRLLPALQQAYSAYANIQGSRASLQSALSLLEQPLPTDFYPAPPMTFCNSITLQRVFFRYNSEGQWMLRDINLEIKKGSRTGFVGKTGSGKSTLIDIVMGLLCPNNGRLLIDGQVITVNNKRNWQAHIAHVPQSVYLSDGSIAENIAFGVEAKAINFDRVKNAASRAQISEVIEQMPLGYETLVGERGVRLSGGQRQRIGIARALYKEADVIIFDEATSALDNETEEAVMSSIEGLGEDTTILIIAHRVTTLRTCSQIIELEQGEIKKVDIC